MVVWSERNYSHKYVTDSMFRESFHVVSVGVCLRMAATPKQILMFGAFRIVVGCLFVFF